MLESQGLIPQHGWLEPCSRFARKAETNNLPPRMCRRTASVQTTLTPGQRDCGDTCVTRMRKSECSDTKGDPPTTKFIDTHLGETVRGALLTKGSDSSFADAHRGLISEPTHKEDEVEDQEDEVEDGRDCEECKVESRREVRHTQPGARALTP